MRMVPGFKETDSYEEDFEKTALIEELLAKATSDTATVLEER